MKTCLRKLSLSTSLGLVAVLGLGSLPRVANASYTSTVAVAPSDYVAGALNLFAFTVGITTNGTAEFVDNISFAFPPGVTVTSGVGPSPFNFCGGGQGNFSNPTPESALWGTPGHPSGCGAFATGTFNFSVTVFVPAGFTGPLTIVATTEGDGWPPPLTDPQVSNFTFALQARTFSAVPLASTWGLAILALLLVSAGSLFLRRGSSI